MNFAIHNNSVMTAASCARGMVSGRYASYLSSSKVSPSFTNYTKIVLLEWVKSSVEMNNVGILIV